MKYKLLVACIACLPWCTTAVQGQGIFRYAELGDFTLENGQVIQDCRIGYRTFGKLNKEMSNAVLLTTWFSGTSKDLAGQIGGPQNRMLDSLRYYIIAVDALGNGVSSSPSNSKLQPGSAFPQFSIRDVVQSQYLLLTQKLRINKLEAVIGISMGGMQTFQWMASHPEFMFKAISIVGSPRLTASDLLLWQTELQAIEGSMACQSNDAQTMKTVAALHAIAATTPEYRARHTKREDFKKYLTEQEQGVANKKPLDWAWQLKAMLAHDIYQDGQTVEQVAKRIITRYVLVVTATQDHMVNPAPAIELAKLIQAETLELTSDCGHQASACESAQVNEAVKRVLKK